jgi:hypothetical protein
MYKSLIAGVAITLACGLAWADDAKATRAERIGIALGLEKTLAAAKAQTVEATKAQMQAVTKQFRQSGMPEEFIAKLQEPMEKMIASTVDSWDVKVAASIYGAVLADSMTDEELVKTERHYQSDEGKKAHATISLAQSKMNEYIIAKSTEVMQKEMGAFMEKVKAIAQQVQREKQQRQLTNPDTK